ncbi:ABC transporter ATP-binding protein [Falsirhodobacter halotolerans]|uniref:ABC transporter ATP-binding protein n=1 Tax=Falsirhodobacter halotolerans TaxID=1146892 RepID=UPI001FCFA819|nr:oligopeptide/dipeptide ABC transporter ATP-binding protein [Falsirhodobacter halotolerans]MCJ8140107.1 ATP-binding cassette domain-containing protein [Falsirhodobacter halotolerans]
MTVPFAEAVNVSKRFTTEPDFAEKIAIRLGAASPRRTVHALDGVDLSIAKGEVVGLVGESGCGKSTLGRVIAGMLPATEGEVRLNGQDRNALSGKAARRARLNTQIIFQDPMSSLNPRKRVVDIIGEAPLAHGLVRHAEKEALVTRLLETVGLDPSMRDRYPHQFSGGQRQRLGIARALAVNPQFLVCDESIAALDISIQAQVLNLFMRLKDEFDLTYLFISHDLSVVHHISDRVVIMYLGRIVESGPTAAIFAEPNHPYTAALLSEVPRIDRRHRAFSPVKGEIPSPLAPPPGCHFHPRCPFATERCRTERPALRDLGTGRHSACHLNDMGERPRFTQTDTMGV